MSRYITAQVERDAITEKRKLSTVIISALPTNPNDVYIQTLGAERLDKLALLFYENASLWWVIASANGLGKGTMLVPGGVNLRIPNITNIQSYINEINTSR
jgi:hypothetical protein